MNSIESLLKEKKNILNIYITAGYPKKDDTVSIVKSLEKAGVDIIEIGMPYSDPLADGPVIQHSSNIALSNGIQLETIFYQIKEIRAKINSLPIIIMGYFNQLMQYGVERFLEKAAASGVDGLIIPDLPIDIYNEKYRCITEELGLDMIFLITPQTSDERIYQIDEATRGFLYVVSSSTTTGNTASLKKKQESYFKRIAQMQLRNPFLIGFGISDKTSFDLACRYASGAIIGSAFIKAIENTSNLDKTIHQFIKKIKS